MSQYVEDVINWQQKEVLEKADKWAALFCHILALLYYKQNIWIISQYTVVVS